MRIPVFKHLNQSWNAEPNAPQERVLVNGRQVQLSFLLNPRAYRAMEGERGCLTFDDCSRWRLGGANDEGWYRGQCRYSASAPQWGEFYELIGEDDRRFEGDDWHHVGQWSASQRHFLFYLRDNTFECFVADWRFARGDDAAGSARAGGDRLE